MKTLYVLDVKQFMYIGQSKKEKVCCGIIEDNDVYRPNEMKVGSLCFLMSLLEKLDNDENEHDIVLCFDSPPTYKRKLAKEKLDYIYKYGRGKPPEHVTYQYELSKIIFPQIGFNCLIAEGLEADDLIASVVIKYREVYDHIIIYSEDSDQYYLIDKKTEVLAIRTNGRSVTYSNYMSNVKRDRIIKYNCINLLKLIESEPTDNIPALKQDVINRLLKMLPEETYPYLGNMTLFRTVFKNIVNNDEESMAIFDLINPILIFDDRSTINRNSKEINYRLFNYYATLFGMYNHKKDALMHNTIGESTIESFLNDLNRR